MPDSSDEDGSARARYQTKLRERVALWRVDGLGPESEWRPVLESGLADDDPYVRRDAIDVCGRLGTEFAVARVFDAIRDPSEVVAVRAAVVFQIIELSPANPAAAAVIASHRDSPAAQAVLNRLIKRWRTFGSMNGDPMSDPDDSQEIQRGHELRAALRKCNPTSAEDGWVPLAEHALVHPSSYVRREGVDVCGRSGAAWAGNCVVSALADHERAAALHAAAICAKLKSQPANMVAALIVASFRDDFSMRGFSARALARYSDERAVARVSELITTDPHRCVRRDAAEAVGRAGNSAALPALRIALADRNQGVREHAQRAIDQLAQRPTTA